MKADIHDEEPGALREAWRALHRVDTLATPFTSFAWTEAWWRHLGRGRKPLSVLVEDAGAVVGLAPLALSRRGPLRVLTGAGVEPGDYWDVLAEPAHRHAVAQAVAARLARSRNHWDALHVKLLAPESPFPAALRDAGLRLVERSPVPAPAVRLPETFEAFVSALPRSRRQNLRRHLKRLDGGDVRLEPVRDRDRLAPALERWQDFRRRQWQAAGRAINPEHLTDGFREFLLSAVQAMVADDLAAVWEFEQAGRPVGCYVNFTDSRCFYWYLGGFHPAAGDLGLGKIAVAEGIRSSIAAGRSLFDFTRGAEPYKYWYGAEDRLLPGLVAGGGSPRSRLGLLAARLAIARRG